MTLIQKYFPDLSPKQLSQFSALKYLYEEWNAKINVISRKDMDHFYEHHVLHSLAIAKYFDFEDGLHIMDIGSGGGFPGIPLAILYPAVTFTLVDSINKKMKVAAAVAEAIGLVNIVTRHTRAEDIYEIRFDAVVSRAVAPLPTLIDWCKGVLNKNSSYGLICLKGGDLNEEINASHVHVSVLHIADVFEEEFFKEKFVLQVK
jgi:16S rRNA (guanine527-N7)-methyltransferase